MTETMTETGANLLATRLREFWAKSPSVQFRVRPQLSPNTRAIFVVRSNLRSGNPPVIRKIAA